MRPGERQVAPDASGIRRDHLARYEFVVHCLAKPQRVIDLACGVGYGSNLLAKAGHAVLGIDKDADVIAYAEEHYAHARVRFQTGDADQSLTLSESDIAVCFETIEHIADPLPLLKTLNQSTKTLYASVPNELQFPWNHHAYHYRHYGKQEFSTLLRNAGWVVTEWHGQQGPESEVHPNVEGRTLIAVCKRAAESTAKQHEAARVPVASPADADHPDHVVILGLGPTLDQYVDLVKRLGGRHKLANEVWGINALGDLIHCDRVFHMDDVLVQEMRAAANPSSNIKVMLEWMKRYQGRIYTSMVDSDGRARTAYPALLEFPLAEVINSTGSAYFNSTAAYAVAFAIHLGVKKISLFGCDFTYAKSHDAEKGRACVEFWLGIASERGIEICIADRSSLMDMCEPDAMKMYGYDAVHVHLAEQAEGPVRALFTPRELPTAAEIELRYDHSRHPNPLVQ